MPVKYLQWCEKICLEPENIRWFKSTFKSNFAPRASLPTEVPDVADAPDKNQPGVGNVQRGQLAVGTHREVGCLDEARQPAQTVEHVVHIATALDLRGRGAH